MPDTRPVVSQCELGMVITTAQRCAEQSASIRARVQAGSVVEPGPLSLVDLPQFPVLPSLIALHHQRMYKIHLAGTWWRRYFPAMIYTGYLLVKLALHKMGIVKRLDLGTAPQ